MSDERPPRPQFGEYATPEDQARAMGMTDAPPSAPSDQPAVGPAVSSTVPLAATRRPRRWDVVLTTALLAYGLLTVVGGSTQGSGLASTIRQVFDQLGIGAFTSDDLARTIGTVLTSANVVLWIVVFVISLTRLRARRLAFFVPLLGLVATFIVTAVLVIVVMVSDPAFQQYVASA